MNRSLHAVLLFALFISFFIFFIFRTLDKKNKSIFSYHRQLKEVTSRQKKKRGVNLMDNTLIGFSGKREIRCADNCKHVFVCGTTGSGKTVALANFILQACNNNYPLIVIDGKGDIDDGSLLSITSAFSKCKLNIINLSELSKTGQYNPFFNASPTVCKDMLIQLSDWSEEHYKINTERYIQRVISLMDLSKIHLSFDTILQFIPSESFIKLSMDCVKANLLDKQQHMNNVELSKISGQIAAAATARFSLLVESELGKIFSPIAPDIFQMLSNGENVIFILNPLLYPETSKLMGRLILLDCKKAVSQLFNDKRRKFFVFDEINTYASSALTDLVNKSRSANVTCILATQSLSDLDFAVNEYFKEQVIENCNNYILLRQNSARNATAWADIIGTEKSAEVTYQVGDEQGRTGPTGKGTLKFGKKYIFHPDDIKNLKTGEGFFISKDTGQKVKVKIKKPF